MVADTIKAATIRTLWYRRVAQPIEQADAVVAAIRAGIVNNSLVGEFSQAERDAMLAVEEKLAELAVLPGVTASVNVPSHRAKAVIIPGVND
jgi:hypothetical protein